MLLKMFERRLRAYRAIGYAEDKGVGGSISSPRGERAEAEPELSTMPEKQR